MNGTDFISVIILILIAWLIYLAPAFLPSLPIGYLGRKRAHFTWWEASAAFVLPFVFWMVSFAVQQNDKGLGNAVEPFILGCSVPIAALIRVVVGTAINRTWVAVMLLFAICALAVLLATWFPELKFQPFVK